MANYSQSTFFTPKDSLTPGDPLKLVKGSDVDGEFSAIQTAIATKLDTAGAGISITGTTASVQWSGLTALGAAPASGDLLAITDISNSNAIRSITLANLADLLAGVVTTTGLSDASGVISLNINSLTEQTGIDGATDFLVMYDASANALRKVAIDDAFAGAGGAVLSSRAINTGTGLTGGGDLSADRTISLSHLGFQNLTDPNDDRIAFWDDSAGAFAWLDIGNGLTITATTIAVDSASTTVDGIVEIATQAEVDAGTDTTRVVTPSTLANYANFPASGQYVVKTSSTSRSSTTTLADDPALAGLSLEASSTYVLTGHIVVSGNGSTTNDFKWLFDYSGTLSSIQGGAFIAEEGGTQTTEADLTQVGVVNFDTAAVDYYVNFSAVIVTSTSGTLDFQWAQNASSATATVLEAGYLHLVKVS